MDTHDTQLPHLTTRLRAPQDLDEPGGMQEQMQRLHRQVRHFIATQEASQRLWGKRMHDEIGQLLSVLCMQLQQTDVGFPLADNSGENNFLKLVKQAIQAVREMTLDLQLSVWEELTLPEVLHSYLVSRFQLTEQNLQVHSHSECKELAPEIVSSCSRIVQEVVGSLHEQGVIEAIQVDIRQDADTVSLTIRIRGSAAPEGKELAIWERSRPGFRAACARIALLGGHWAVEASPADVFAITACVPLQPPVPDPTTKNRMETS